MVVMVDEDLALEGSFANLVGISDDGVNDESRPRESTLHDFGGLSGTEIQDDEYIEPSDGSVSLVGGNNSLQYELAPQQVASSSSSFDIDKHVRLALQSQPVQVLKQAWESGVWSSIFSDSNNTDSSNVFGQELYRPTAFSSPVMEESAVETSSKEQKLLTSYKQVVRFKPDLTWKEQTDAALQSSVKMWYMLIQRWKNECAMYIETHKFRWESEALTMLLDIFAARSPYTLRKRALALMHVCDYLDSAGCSRFLITERDMYAFLCKERNLGAPSSRFKGYMQAVTFCRFVLDMTELDETVNSARCKGMTKQKKVSEKKLASPLLVKEVKILHDMLTSGSDVWQRLFAGAALFCLYSRARWGDLMRAETVLVDCDSSGVACYLEARVGSHKTMQSQQHRHQFLPMVAPGLGVTDGNRIEQWLHARNSLSLDFCKDCVMPAPQPDGSPDCRPLNSQEAAGRLRLVLFGNASPLPDRKVASHSLKATTLSYAAKRGMDINLRMQLGYHTQPYRMGLTYSRDGAAASIAALEQLLCEIRLQLFLPDETRSGRLVKSAIGSGNFPIVIKDEGDGEANVEAAPICQPAIMQLQLRRKIL